MLVELIKFLLLSICIVLITKFMLIPVLRKIIEELNLSNKVAGKIIGISTSLPELISAIVSSCSGLLLVTTYNIISSNIINVMLFYISIIFNKNIKYLKNKKIKIELIMVSITILFSILLLGFKNNSNIYIVIFLMISYLIYNSFNKEIHKKLINIDFSLLKKHSKNILKIILYIILIILTGGLLFIVGYYLENVLTTLSYSFEIPSIILGFILGISTSIPEFITFFSSQKVHLFNRYKGVEEATSNLLSSNMFNLCIVESIAIIIYIILF